MSLAKLGLHILSGYAGALGHPRIVKAVDPSDQYLTDLRKQVGPDCLLVVRWTLGEQPLDDPVARGREWYARFRPRMGDANAVYEGYNEIADSQAPQFAAFEVERLRLMHEGQRRSGVLSCSVGTPDLPTWNTYCPALAAMNAGDVVALHEYYVDGPDLANPWHVGRWRMVAYPEFARQKLVITELGRDVVEGRGYPGWHLDPACSANTYLSEFRRYGDLADAEPRVLGVVVFTGGQIVDPRWQPYEVNSLWPLVVAEQGPAPVLPTPPSPSVPRLTHPLVYSRVSQVFGANPAYYAKYGLAGHNGLDLAVPDGNDVMRWHGEPVIAAHPGKAIIVRDDPSYGIYVYLWGSWCDTLYAHLCEATLPSSGQVQAGDLLGFVGYTGVTIPVGLHGCHLHFGLRRKPYQMQNGFRGYNDPAPYLP